MDSPNTDELSEEERKRKEEQVRVAKGIAQRMETEVYPFLAKYADPDQDVYKDLTENPLLTVVGDCFFSNGNGYMGSVQYFKDEVVAVRLAQLCALYGRPVTARRGVDVLISLSEKCNGDAPEGLKEALLESLIMVDEWEFTPEEAKKRLEKAGL